MLWFIFAVILFVIALGSLIYGLKGSSVGGILTAVGTVLLGGLFLFFATFYTNGQGEAKVIVDAFNRSAVGTVTTPMAGFKSPFQDLEDFDIFANDLTYAGQPGNAPAYTGGKVSGAEVTVSVGGIAGGSTQGFTDIQVVYNIRPDAVQSIYEKYKSQPRFTQMIVEKQFLDTVRQIPSGYTATEYRGAKRAEVAQKILEALNGRLGSAGVEITSVTIQDVRYTQQVEEALTGLEVAAQQKEKAKLEADAAVTRAKGEADAKIQTATGEAQANKLLNDSLTDKVLQSRWIDAMRAAGEKGSIIVTDGKAPVIVQK